MHNSSTNPHWKNTQQHAANRSFVSHEPPLLPLPIRDVAYLTKNMLQALHSTISLLWEQVEPVQEYPLCFCCWDAQSKHTRSSGHQLLNASNIRCLEIQTKSTKNACVCAWSRQSRPEQWCSLYYLDHGTRNVDQGFSFPIYERAQVTKPCTTRLTNSIYSIM